MRVFVNVDLIFSACTAPPVLPNAVLDPAGDTLIGSVRRYTCMKGYVPTGPIEVGCISGTGGPLWTAPEFQCVSEYGCTRN